MKKLLKYIAEYKKECIIGPAVKLLEALFDLIVPLVIAAVIDNGIAKGDTGYIVRMCLVLVLLGVVGLGCAVVAQYFAAKASVGFASNLRHALFEHLGRLSSSQTDKLGTSTMITRLTSDTNQVQSGVNLGLRLLLRSPLIVFGSMIMAFTINVRSALIFAGVIPVLSAVVFGIMLISMPLYKKVQASLDRVLKLTRENLTGARVIRAFCTEEDEKKKFHSANESLTVSQKTVGRVSALLNPLTYVLINIAVLILIKVGAIEVYEGVMTQGMVIALYNYMSQILVELIKLANLIVNITKSEASAKRIAAVLEIEPEMENGVSESADDAEYSVEFRNASLRYGDNREPSVSGISFFARKGETIGIIGGTGSGKSSVVNMIPRFYDCESGEVLVDGINVKDYNLLSLRAKTGVVPQKAVLFRGTIRDNMRWGNADATDEEIYAALETAQARDVVDSKENALDYMIEQGGRNLSGGQRQRLTIARALVRKPEILILDDSSSALDYQTDARLRAALQKLNPKPTVFIVSQRTASVRWADRIVVLEDGEIQSIGTHGELLEKSEIYREIYNSQFSKEENGHEKK